MTCLSSKYHPPFYDGRAVLFITVDVMERVGKEEKKKEILDQSTLARFALVQRQLALEV